MTAKAAVIGSGPAGLMAALTAAEQGRDVTIFEALPSPGRKLLASGAGKCNFTNMLSPRSMAEHFAPEERRFVRSALLDFTPQKVRDFFADQHVAYKLVDDFYCFPQSEKAGDILQALLNKALELGVKILCNTAVTDLVVHDDKITQVVCNEKIFGCDYLIAAGGGPGYPALGDRGSLDRILQSKNVSMVPRTQALCGLKSRDLWMQDLAGIVIDKVNISLDKANFSSGTLLFTGDGISGPAVLDISGRVAKVLTGKELCTVKIELIPGKNADYFKNLLSTARQNNGRKQVKNIFNEPLPQAVLHALINHAGAGDMSCANLTKSAASAIIECLTACPVNIHATEKWEKSMSSTGGADRKQIDPFTMQSKQISNLYFAGEFIDVDAPCGGYNIQWALSSGYVAGMLKSKS